MYSARVVYLQGELFARNEPQPHRFVKITQSMTGNELWRATLGELELSLTKANFTTWFKNTSIVGYENGKVTIAVPNAFTKMWLENKYHQAIAQALQRVTRNPSLTISYTIDTQKGDAPTPPRIGKGTGWKELVKEKYRGNGEAGISEKYAFENFVVGKTNELAHAACVAVAAKPGESYNPLFIYGGSGLGKTHLLHAIGNEIQKRFPTKRVLYVTCERFTNEFVYAISRGGIEQFKSQYRSVDVLLIDDIQFLAGKEGTQEEFFHTFNTLHQANKQIVVSSDRQPKAIPSLERRLVSRFEWGMVVDIGSPDLETRLAILRAKAREKHYNLSLEIANLIATTVQNNVRELEGALNHVIAAHELHKGPPDTAVVKHILTSFSREVGKRTLTAKTIVHAVADFYEVKIEDLVGGSRRKELVYPRQITMYLLREDAKCSYPTIGNELGGRDHTTAIHACEKINRELQQNERMKEEVTILRERLYTKSV